jgi:arylsulfatase A-like enzyme
VDNLKSITLSALMLSQVASLYAVESPAKRPNILIILSDDLGYADAGFNGCIELSTPNLDKLARSGVICSSGYVTHPFSSPSRAGLLTGRYQARFGHENNPGYNPLDTAEGLPLSERLLPQFLKTAGYKTGWVGKWHLGASPGHTPWRRGFDETFGFIAGGHNYIGWKPNKDPYNLALTRNGEPVDVNDHLTTLFGNEAAGFVLSNTDTPWMLYLAFNAPHVPHQPTSGREAQFSEITDPQRRKYLAQISLLDDAVGSVIAALEKSGQTERTIIFFFSDNGGPTYQVAQNTPLRGGKGMVYEGGIRVPFVISWPGKLPSGTTYSAPVSSLDIFATSLALAGIKMPSDRKYDGVNIVPYLSGKKKTIPHEYLFWRAENGRLEKGKRLAYAVLAEKWKLVRLLDKPAELYDLSNDIGESIDLAKENPRIVARLTAALDAWEKEMIQPVFPGV